MNKVFERKIWGFVFSVAIMLAVFYLGFYDFFYNFWNLWNIGDYLKFILGCSIGVLTLMFFINFCIASFVLGNNLNVNLIKENKYQFKLDILNDTYAEFKTSWHNAKSENADGSTNYKEFKTETASNYFRYDNLIGNYCHADFFKHIPGVLTGMGIIGTFNGLIHGLHAFQKNGTNQDELQSGLFKLLDAVSEAFILSAIAIGIAILITLIEKMVVSVLQRKLENFNYEIDKKIHSKTSEDYLHALVESNEKSQTQLTHLKENFINDLKPIFEAQTQAFAQIITDGFADAIGKIGKIDISKEADSALQDILKKIADAQTLMFENLENTTNKLGGNAIDLSDKLTQISESHDTNYNELKDALLAIIIANGKIQENLNNKVEELGAGIVKFYEIINAMTGLGTELIQSSEKLINASTIFDQAAININQSSENIAKSSEESSQSLATMTNDINNALGVISEISQRFSEVQKNYDDYLSKINNILIDSHQTYSKQLNETITENNAVLKDSLQDIVNKFANLNENLNEAIENLIDKLPNNALLQESLADNIAKKFAKINLNENINDAIKSIIDKLPNNKS